MSRRSVGGCWPVYKPEMAVGTVAAEVSFHDLYFGLKMAIYRPKQLLSNKYITSYLVVLDGITYTYTLLLLAQQNEL
jgi:hypothetical protein